MFKEQHDLYERRISVFINRLKELWYENKQPLNVTYCLYDPMVPFDRRQEGDYLPIKPGDSWGKNWQRAWFHVTGTIPQEWAGRKVVAKINLGGEGCLFDSDGTPLQGLSFHTLWMDEFVRERYDVTESAVGGEKLDLWVEASASQLFGLQLERDPALQSPRRYGHYEAAVKDASLALFRQDIWQLYLDVMLLNDLMKSLPADSVRRSRIRRAVNRAIDRFQEEGEAVEAARELLRPELAKPAGASDLQTIAVGHAHIDTAWLWPISETIRKCARTFSSQIALIEKYPSYIFGASQPQHYAFIKEYYPSLYEKIRQKVKEGRWEVQGGMWVEADCNLIDGESIVRQILYGKKFFKHEFDVEVRNLWIPDVFGYSAAMPQILKKSGLDYLVTQKISWNQFNKFPHNTFIWQGIDGSQVLAHFPPENNYNSLLLPSGLRRARENFAEKAFADEFLTLYGIGDGGGGPTEEIIETGIRQANLEETPRVVFGKAQEFLDRLENYRDDLAVWTGELYLELHRGTLTTQAHNKKMNRMLEYRLRQLEMLFSAGKMERYPADQLESMWKKLLINQFHDILPGSSINLVYKDSRKAYSSLTGEADALALEFAQNSLVRNEECLTIINTCSYDYQRAIQLPGEWSGYAVKDGEDNSVSVQQELNGAVVFVKIPAFQTMVLRRGQRVATQIVPDFPEQLVLENELVRYEIDRDGKIVSAFDKEIGRELFVDKKAGNVLRLYEDRPADWDAWDIDIFYESQLLEEARLVTAEWCAYGPVRQGIKLSFTVGTSEIEQCVYLMPNSKRLDFETKINWQERHKMLRVGFEVDVQADQASYDIQFGYIRRPTHRNTSWDMAKFEGVAHKFVDLSDTDYGVAVLNNCKYGHKVYGNLMEINLLRSPTNPDPEADRGWHEFTYSLLPHTNSLAFSDVFFEAAQLNNPPALFPSFEAPEFGMPVSLSNDSVVLEVMKKAETDDGVMVRLHEARGRSARTTLLLDKKFIKAFQTNLMEEKPVPVEVVDGKVELQFTPFEIKTFKLVAAEN